MVSPLSRTNLEHTTQPLNRHTDTGKYLSQYAQNSLVRCIACGTIGQVISKTQYNATTGRYHYKGSQFTCSHCQLKLVKCQNQHDWVGSKQIYGRQKCYYCGTRLSVSRKITNSYQVNIPKTLCTSCPNCHNNNNIAVSDCYLYSGNLGIDPIFGLPLFLRINCRFGMIWVFDATHLSEMQAFITAKLRERTKLAGNGSMISRLPAWIKDSKNREMISKKLAQLQKSLDDYNQQR